MYSITPTVTSVPSKKASINSSLSSLKAFSIAGIIASLDLTFEIPKLEPALFGLTKENKVKTNVNYALNTGDIELKVGTSLGFNQQSFDVNRINTPVGPDPRLTGNNTGRYFTLDVGAVAYYHGFVAGVSS